MGYYDTESKLISESSCSGKLLNVLLKATLDGFQHGDRYDQCIPWFFCVEQALFPSDPGDIFDNGFDTLEIADSHLEIHEYEDCGLDPSSISKFHEYLGRSVFALDSTSALDSSYDCDYSIGGQESGRFTIKDGVFTELYYDSDGYYCSAYLDEDTFDDLEEKFKTAETDEELDRIVREFCSIEGAEPSDLLELGHEFHLEDRIRESAERLNIELKYELYEPRPVRSCENPEFHVNWTGDGTYAVISAARETGELEAVPNAVRKGYITREQLEAALEVSNNVPDAEVSAILLQLLKDK